MRAMARDFGLSEIFFVSDGLDPRHFGRLAGRGVAWVEVVWHPVIGALDERRARQSAEGLDAVGVACHSVHAPFSAEHDPSSLDSCIRTGTLDAYRRCLDLLHGLGGQVLVVHPGYEPIGPGQRQDRLRYSADLLAQTGALCDQAGVTLAVENLHHGPIGRSPQELDAVLDGWSHGQHGVCFDVAHAFCDIGVAAFLRDLASPIVSLHLCDNVESNRESTCWPMAPGGLVDWTATVRALQEKGCDCVLMFEVYEGGRPDPDRDGLDQLAETYARLRELFTPYPPGDRDW